MISSEYSSMQLLWNFSWATNFVFHFDIFEAISFRTLCLAFIPSNLLCIKVITTGGIALTVKYKQNNLILQILLGKYVKY